MKYLYRLLFIPVCYSLALYFLINVLRLALPQPDQTASLLAILGIPFLVAFHIQLQQIDLLDRIDCLEQLVERLRDQH